jgi:1-acyl-sn-glycerol-3-phosphate acyltransferase
MTPKKKQTKIRGKAKSPKAFSVAPPSSAQDRTDPSAQQLEAEGTNQPPRPPRRRRPPPVPPAPAVRRRTRLEKVMDERPTLDSLPVERASDPQVVTRIRELEARLDRMIHARSRDRAAEVDAEDDADGVPTARSVPPRGMSSRPPEPDGMLDGARELLSPGFYMRKWGRVGLRNRSEEVDEFGYDPVYEEKVLPFFDFLYEKYFRVETHDVERVPAEGRCLLVANHSGTVPFDGVMLRRAVRREHTHHREVRWLAEDGIFHLPFLGSFTNRMGAVRACQENAERLLDQEALVAVFPEGVKGIGKLFKERYKLQRFGRGGFVKLGLRTRTPVVPVAIVGGEETNPMLSRVEYLTRAIGIPYLPVTPTFPLLGPLGLLPAPTKWKIYFGEPIDLAEHGAESAEDELLVGRLTEQIRAEIQRLLDAALRERRSVWFG